MAKKITEEDLRLNIIINGDQGRKALSDLKSTVDASTKKLSQLKSEMSKLEAQGRTSSSEYGKLNAAIQRETITLESNRQKLASLERQQSVNTMTLAELRKHIKLTGIALSHAVPGTEEWNKLNGELQQSKTRLKELAVQSKATEGVVKGLTTSWSDVWALGHMAIRGSKMAWGAITQATDAFQEYDEAVTDAMKTTNLSKDEVMAMGDAFKKMDTRTAQNELMALLRIGGKLGISGQEDLMGFVEAADKINVALSEDLGGNAEAAIAAIGKMTDIFSLAEEFGQGDAMLKIASAINSLGMASTANEGYMVDFAKRLAGIAPSADISIDKVLGLAATLDKYGQTAEVSSTSIGQTIVAMYKKTETFAEIAGLSFGEFKQLLDTDVNEALLRVVEGMKGATDDGFAPIVAAMDGMGLNGQRAVTVLGTLAKNSEEVRAQQALANQAFTEGTSVIDEFNTKNNSAAATLEKTKKSIHDQIVVIGQQLMPVVQGVMDVAEMGVKALSVLIGHISRYKTVLALLVVVKYADIAAAKIKNALTLANIRLMAQQLLGIKGIRAATLLWVAAKKLLTLQIGASTRAFKLFVKTLLAGGGPLGWIIAGVTALATGMIHFISKSRESTKALRELNKQTTDTIGAISSARTQIDAERKELEKLSTAATSAAIGTRERAAAIKAINDKYGDYLPALLTEKTSNNDIKTALKGVNDELERKILLQAKEQELVKVQEHKTNTIKAALESYMGLFERINGRKMNAAEISSFAGTLSQTYDSMMTDKDSASLNYRAYRKDDWTQSGSTLLKGRKTVGMIAQNNAQKRRLWNINEEFETAIKKGKELKAMVDGLYGNAASSTGGLGSGGTVVASPTVTTTTTATDPAEDATKEATEEAARKAQEEAERREKEKNETMARYSSERYRMAVDEENRRYEAEKKNAEGNAAYLEAVERRHSAAIARIRLDELSDRQKELDDLHRLELQSLENRHNAELAAFEGSEEDRKAMQERQNDELLKENKRYITELGALLADVTGADHNILINLDDADLVNVLRQVKELEAKIAELSGNDFVNYAGGGTTGKSSGSSADDGGGEQSGGGFFGSMNSSVLGVDAEGFNSLIESLKNGKLSADDMANAVSLIGNAAQWGCEVAGKAIDVMNAKENKAFKQYEKAQDKRKKALSDRVDAGLMTEAQYNAEVAAMEAEKDAKQEELALKQAKRQKALALVQAIINTAMAVTSALASPPPASFVMAGIAAAMGAVEIALIAAQPITTGYEEGGLTEVKREQDGKVFKVRLSPERGMIGRPTALVGENGSEYVIPHEGLENPTLAPFLGTIEQARRAGTLKSIDFNALYSPAYSIPGRVSGGYTIEPGTLPSTSQMFSGSDMAALMSAVSRLNSILSHPITAEVAMLGRRGIVENLERYEKQRKNGRL